MVTERQRTVCRTLPFCHLRIRGVRRPLSPYQRLVKRCPEHPSTIGEHLRKRRIELGLEQKQVADILEVHRGSIQNWERNKGEPLPVRIPGIIRLLGYIPFSSGHAFPERLAFYRKCAGLTQEELATRAGFGRDLVERWENGGSQPKASNLPKVEECLEGAIETLDLVGLVGRIQLRRTC